MTRHFTFLFHLWSSRFLPSSFSLSFDHPLFSSLFYYSILFSLFPFPLPRSLHPSPLLFFSSFCLSLSALILLALFFLGLLPLLPLKGYESVSINPEDFEDKVVLILGRGLSIIINHIQCAIHHLPQYTIPIIKSP